MVLVVASDPLNKIRVSAKIMSLKLFGGGHITIFVTVFAIDNSVVNNERTLTIYVSQCSEMCGVRAGVVSVSIG